MLIMLQTRKCSQSNLPLNLKPISNMALSYLGKSFFHPQRRVSSYLIRTESWTEQSRCCTTERDSLRLRWATLNRGDKRGLFPEWGKFKLGKVYFRKKKVREGNCFVDQDNVTAKLTNSEFPKKKIKYMDKVMESNFETPTFHCYGFSYEY